MIDLKRPSANTVAALAISAGILCTGIVATAHPAFSQTRKLPPAKTKPVKSQANVPIGFGSKDLPIPVAEMRDAILAAARTGNLDELLIPIQWNELPPDFGALPVKETLAAWRKNPRDPHGRAKLAQLIKILEAPYTIVRLGPDAENNKIFIWPYFAEANLSKLSPALEVTLLQLVTATEFEVMKKHKTYDHWGLSIGADGTWHTFKRIKKPYKSAD